MPYKNKTLKPSVVETTAQEGNGAGGAGNALIYATALVADVAPVISFVATVTMAVTENGTDIGMNQVVGVATERNETFHPQKGFPTQWIHLQNSRKLTMTVIFSCT